MPQFLRNQRSASGASAREMAYARSSTFGAPARSQGKDLYSPQKNIKACRSLLVQLFQRLRSRREHQCVDNPLPHLARDAQAVAHQLALGVHDPGLHLGLLARNNAHVTICLRPYDYLLAHDSFNALASGGEGRADPATMRTARNDIQTHPNRVFSQPTSTSGWRDSGNGDSLKGYRDFHGVHSEGAAAKAGGATGTDVLRGEQTGFGTRLTPCDARTLPHGAPPLGGAGRQAGRRP